MNIQGGAVSRLNTTAEIVSYAGVVPFVLCLLGVALLPNYGLRELAQRVAISYGAVVLAFVEIYGVAITSSAYRSILIYGVFIAILMVRPQGLLGRKTA